MDPLLTFSDSIVLDETVPSISNATLLTPPPSGGNLTPSSRIRSHKTKKPIYEVQLHASETISGISSLETGPRPRGGTLLNLRNSKKRGFTTLNRTYRVSASSPPAYIRVRSAAGKWSVWMPLASATAARG